MGDGLLLEFPSVVAAVECAVRSRNMMVGRNIDTPEVKRIVYRIGVHLGDVLIDGADILGEGVNIAARLESICERRVIRPSMIRSAESLLSVSEPSVCLTPTSEGGRGIRNRLCGQNERRRRREGGADDQVLPGAGGVRLAYAISGSGPPLVRSGNGLNHLDMIGKARFGAMSFAGCRVSIRSTLRRQRQRHVRLGRCHALARCLGDRLETVVDAVGVERFPLLGTSQGCAVAVAYAVRRPERVSHLILYGGFALGGNKRTPGEKEMRRATMTLMRLGWGADNPSFGKCTPRDYSRGTHEQADYFNDCNGERPPPSARLDIMV